MAASLAKARWRILSQAVQGLQNSSEADPQQPQNGKSPSVLGGVNPVSASRRPRLGQGFGLIPTTVLSPPCPTGDLIVQYTLPCSSPTGPTTILLRQRAEATCLRDELVIAQESGNDSTGIVGVWPAEEVLAYYCVQHPDIFRGKRVLELGAGCGLAGMAVAACTEAQSVTLTDGNPRVVSALVSSLEANGSAFGDACVSAQLLRWEESGPLEIRSADVACRVPAGILTESYDIIIAADCTFFSEAHSALASTIRRMLAATGESRAIMFNPRRGKALDDFVGVASESGLDTYMVEDYDKQMSDLRVKYSGGNDPSWPSYDEGHCYPILMQLERQDNIVSV